MNDPLNRMQGMLMRDKCARPDRIAEVMKADVYELLSSYMDLKREDISLTLEVGEKGKYIVRIIAISPHIREIGLPL